MGISDWLGLGKTVSEPIKAVSELYTTDKARLAAEAKLTEADAKFEDVKQKPKLALLEIEKILAMSSNLFKSGYIPAAGWTSGFLVLCYYFPQLVVMNYIWAKASIVAGHCLPFPMRPDDILNLVYVMCAGGVHNILSKITK
jgi:hypothetical protein